MEYDGMKTFNNLHEARTYATYINNFHHDVSMIHLGNKGIGENAKSIYGVCWLNLP